MEGTGPGQLSPGPQQGDHLSVLVSGVPDEEEGWEQIKDKIWIYFQKEMSSGGGDIFDLERLGNGKVKVTFVEKEAAERVASRESHAFQAFEQTYPLQVKGYWELETPSDHDDVGSRDGDGVASQPGVAGPTEKLQDQTSKADLESSNRQPHAASPESPQAQNVPPDEGSPIHFVSSTGQPPSTDGNPPPYPQLPQTHGDQWSPTKGTPTQSPGAFTSPHPPGHHQVTWPVPMASPQVSTQQQGHTFTGQFQQPECQPPPPYMQQMYQLPQSHGQVPPEVQSYQGYYQEGQSPPGNIPPYPFQQSFMPGQHPGFGPVQQATGAAQGQMPFDPNTMQIIQGMMYMLQQQQMQQPGLTAPTEPMNPTAAFQSLITQATEGSAATHQKIPQMTSPSESLPTEVDRPCPGQTPSPLKKTESAGDQDDASNHDASKQRSEPSGHDHETENKMKEPRHGGPQESLKEDEPGMQLDTGEEGETNTTVEVTGFSETTSRDAIRYYFEGPRSGGGDIKNCVMDEANQRILITFKDKSVFTRVLSKNMHRVSGTNLTIKEACCRSKAKTPVDKSRILLRDVPETTEETLIYFVEALSGEGHTPSSFLYGKETGTIMVLFSEDITDIDMLIKKCEKKTLKDEKITAEEVHFTDCIVVENLPPEIHQDTIVLYFQNARRSGGGDIIDIEYNKKERKAVVFYKDYTVIERVLQRTHKLQDTQLAVKPFYTCLGSAASDATSPPVKVPDPIEIPVNKNVLSFVVVNEELRKALENDMSRNNAEVKWLQEDSEFVIIIPTENQSNPSAKDSWESWEGEVREVLQNFLTNNVDTKTVEVLQALWEAVIRKMKELGMKTTPSCVVQTNDDAHTITITGSRKATTIAHTQITGVVEALEKELKRKKFEVTECVDDLSLSELRFLQASKFQSHLKSSLPNLTVTINTDTQKVEFKGLPDEIKSAKADMFDKVRKLKPNKIKVTPAVASFLQGEVVMGLLTDTLQNKGVVAIIEVDGNDVTISAEKNNIRRATEVFQTSITEKPIKVSLASAFVLKMEKWDQLKNKLEREARRHLKITVQLVEGQPCIHIVGLPEPVKGAAGKVSSFLETNAIEEEQVPDEQGVVLFLKEHHEKEMRSIEKELEEYHVKIVFIEQKDEHKLLIRGTSNGVKSAVGLVKKVMKGVIRDFHPVRRPGMAKHFTEESGKVTLNSVGGLCQCIITVIDNRKRTESAASSFDMRPLDSEPSLPEEPALKVRATIELDNKKKILVCFDDLTKHEADVIVNPANSDLDHIGGLAKAIVEAGGQEIQEECHAILESMNGHLLVGEVVASSPGKLRNCQMIVHAVGPEWHGGDAAEEDTLYEAISNSLLKANEYKFHSIAIPAVSSGIFQFPLPACAKNIVEAAVDFLTEEESSLEEVRFVNNEESTVQAFVEAVQAKFGGKVVIESSKAQPEPDLSRGKVSQRRRRLRSKQPNSAASGASPTPAPSVEPSPMPKVTHSFPKIDNGILTPEGKTVLMMKANIASQRVDAIVNTTQNSLNLNTGAVSKAILQQAGEELQQAVSAAKSANVDSVDDGFVFSTGSAKLRCKRVVHCVCCGWDNGKGQSEKVLRDILQKCLQEGQKGGLQSIAFPAIGTGGLGFPHDLVAQVMFAEVMKFSSKNPGGSLKEIRFVIYEGDEDSIVAFEKELKRIQLSQAGIDPSSEAYLEEVKADKKTPTKTSKMWKGRLKTGSFKEPRNPTDVTPEGHRRPMFSEMSSAAYGPSQMSIGPLTLQVQQGNIVEECTDAIVNSTDKYFSLEGGVGSAIRRAAGPQVEAECKRLLGRSMSFSGNAAVTGSGNLDCKKILHAIAPDRGNGDTKGWKTVMKACLKKADSERLSSVSFPVLGTGQLARHPSVMATTMLEAIAEFVSEQKFTTLSMVRIILFERNMVATFKEEMEKKSGQPLGNKLSWFGKLTSYIWPFGATADPTPPPQHTLAGKTAPDDDVVLAIFAGSKDNVEKAKDMIEKVMSEKSHVDIITDPNISKLTTDEELQIEALKSDDVKVLIKKGKRVSRVQLEGLTKDVLFVRTEIEDILKDIAKRESFKEKAKRMKEDVQWFYIEEDEKHPYDETTNALIEEAFQAKKKTVHFETEGERVYIDFATNKEIVKDGSEELEPLDVLRVDHRREAIKLPDYWDPMDDVDVILVGLKSSDKEYIKVRDAFMDTISNTNAKIQKIQRVQNPSLFKQYSVLKMKMEAKNSKPVEKILYHGTEASSVDPINHSGFNRSYSGDNVGAINGKGVYFACQASYSADTNYATPDKDGLRHMYVARVLTGEYCKGKKDIVVPPAKDPSKPLVLYDSVCDNEANPSAFVIFKDAQAYPDYLIKFTK